MAQTHKLLRIRNQLQYPSPFLDIASTYTPATMKEMFKWTRYFYYSSSIMSPIVYKLSEYPVTGLIYNGKGKKALEMIMEKNLKIKTKLVEINLDYHVFGNCFLSIFYPFRRFLKCKSCDEKFAIEDTKYEWKKLWFRGKCEKCSHEGEFDIEDQPVQIKKEVKLIRWSPFNIDIDWNPVTDDHIYTYSLPGKIKRSIVAGNKNYIEKIPLVFLEAVKNKKMIELDQNNLYHYKRPNIADEDMGWGMPIVLPVLKDIFFLTILKKGNEAIALGHIVPWRIIYPSANADSTPYMNTNLGGWKSRMEGEVKKWRKDPNHISIMPIPTGFQSFGGDAKMLLTTNEEKLTQQSIAGGVGVPLELLFGTMSWSGSSVSLRILENHFINNRENTDTFLSDFLVPRLNSYFGISDATVEQKSFKMADDIQFKGLIGNLNAAGKISSEDFLGELGYDYEEQSKKIMKEIDTESEIMEKRMKLNAITQNVVNRLNVIAQQRMQAEQGTGGDDRISGEVDPTKNTNIGQGAKPAEGGKPAGGVKPDDGGGQKTQQGQQGQQANDAQTPGGGAGIDVPTIVTMWAGNIAKLPPGQREKAMQRIAVDSPETAKAVEKQVSSILKEVESGMNMKNLPEQRPPRSKNSTM